MPAAATIAATARLSLSQLGKGLARSFRTITTTQVTLEAPASARSTRALRGRRTRGQTARPVRSAAARTPNSAALGDHRHDVDAKHAKPDRERLISHRTAVERRSNQLRHQIAKVAITPPVTAGPRRRTRQHRPARRSRNRARTSVSQRRKNASSRPCREGSSTKRGSVTGRSRRISATMGPRRWWRRPPNVPVWKAPEVVGTESDRRRSAPVRPCRLTGLRNAPMPSISTSTTSPSPRKRCGSRHTDPRTACRS